MKTYQVVLEPQSPFSSPIQADTLFGAFCWSWKRLYGEASLLKLLNEYKEGNPPFLFTNLFPYGLLPKPMKRFSYIGEEKKETTKEQRLKKYQGLKTIKKQKYVTLEGFNVYVAGGNTMGEDDNGIDTVTAYGNQVNRRYGTVGADEEGSLFTRDEIYSVSVGQNGEKTGGRVWFLVKVNAERERYLEPVLELMSNLGIGGHKSIGRGYSKLIEYCCFDGFPIPQEPQAFVTLSNFIPHARDPVEGYYQIILKYGKVDREYASSENPFKKPLVMITEGSVFKTNDFREYYGCMAENISDLKESILQYGLAFPVPIRLRRED